MIDLINLLGVETKGEIMKTIALLVLLSIGLVSAAGCHHHHNNRHHYSDGHRHYYSDGYYRR